MGFPAMQIDWQLELLRGFLLSSQHKMQKFKNEADELKTKVFTPILSSAKLLEALFSLLPPIPQTIWQ